MVKVDRPSRYPSISVLICTLNEAENLPHVLPKIPHWVDEVLIIDGHSTDGTVQVAKELRPDCRILQQLTKGKGEALKYGIEQAKGDIIVTLDADGTTDAGEINKFIEPLLNGYAFTKGSRFLKLHPEKMPLHRRFGNWILVVEANLLFGTRYTDLCSGYNGFWEKDMAKVKFPDDFGFEPIITLRAKKAGLKLIEVACVDRGRIHGDSRLSSWHQGWGAFKAILKERFFD